MSYPPNSGPPSAPTPCAASTPSAARSPSTSSCTASTASPGRGPSAATPGQPAYLMGPSGAYAPDPAADWHLLAGDEAAVPAISAALEALPDNAIGKVFIEVAGPDDEIELTRAGRRRGPLDLPRRPRRPGARRQGRRQRAADRGRQGGAVAAGPGAGVHPRRGADRHAQPAALHPQGTRRRRQVGVSISGYWRRGRTEETFRQWKRELAEAEATA